MMKRKATEQLHPAISAVAARRARQAKAAIERTPTDTRSTENSSSREIETLPSPVPYNQARAPQEPAPVARDAAPVKVSPGAGALENRNRNQPTQPETTTNGEGNAPEPAADNFLLSKSQFTRDNIIYGREDAVCIRLPIGETLAVIGRYDIWVKRGVVSVMGAKLYPCDRLYRVYAPSTHSLPIIKSVSGINGFSEFELISVEDGLSELSRISNLYRRIWNGSAEISTRSLFTLSKENASFSLLASSGDDPYKRPLRPLHLDKKWSSMIKRLSQRGRDLCVLTCGPGGSGKSTFNRYLLNHLLSPPPEDLDNRAQHGEGVLFLDLDPGQPEFSPIGHVYLAHIRAPALGPPLSHPLLCAEDGSIIRAHHIGSSSPKDDSKHYVRCTMNLLRYYYGSISETYSQCPLIINYPGWIFGQGLEILTGFLEALRLSDVVYMSETGPEEVAGPLKSVARGVGTPFWTLPSQPTEYATRSSGQLRQMQMLSYFHMQESPCSTSAYWSATPLAHTRAVKVAYSGSSQGILGVMIAGFPHDKEHIFDLLDGAIVAVVAIERADAIKPVHDDVEPAEVLFRAEEDSRSEEDAAEDEGSTAVAAATTATSPAATTTLQTLAERLQPHLHRTKENIPYLFSGNGTCSYLNPRHSRSLGLALVRSIDTTSQALELIMPIRSAAVRDALERGHQIVLVRGQLDNPDWALMEEYFAAKWAHKHLPSRLDKMRREKKSQREMTIYQERVKERVRRAMQVPWVHPEQTKSGSPGKKKEKRDVWKLRRDEAADSSGSEREW
ncbi:grc3 [Nannizzia gypsea CBS 118893]|uniref:Polynucleotide 5'-hydroxyl-kinase GRC3 n=1 Tax=Arthroderma gypseum (strain ATCC MYA-4604 / CBS 118893) TaxID=535722 RepID=E5R0F6_ARTGP|nr:grc3 [Nannizzia gypsea CBS 118893]EFQ97515.1 grc3 [Nannizzia gypsea CBS 118893]